MSSRLGDLYSACFSEYRLCHPQVSTGKAQSEFNIEWKKIVDVKKKKTSKENEEAAETLLRRLREEKTNKQAASIVNFFKVCYLLNVFFLCYFDNECAIFSK